MTDQFFTDPGVLQRLRSGPLGCHIDSFSAVLSQLGYARSTIQKQLYLVADLSHWLGRAQLATDALGEQRVAEFLKDRQKRGLDHRGHGPTLGALLEHLRTHGIIPARVPSPEDNPARQMEGEFARYLREERGLSPVTIATYAPVMRTFVASRFGSSTPSFDKLRAADVSDFILRHLSTVSPSRARSMGIALRCFFRFLRLRGKTATDLAASVPPMVAWRSSALPKHLSPDQVETLLKACDRSERTGPRDYAILLLLARLGLRAGEVVALTLDDIDWRSGEITVRGKGHQQDRLPLPRDVGKALATYLRSGRPRCATRRLFVRVYAPHRGFAGPSNVTQIVRKTLGRAGLSPPRKGAHILRHSLATRMLQSGASMAEIGQILRHRQPRSTEIYAKVDQKGLQALALPWPAEGGAL